MTRLITFAGVGALGSTCLQFLRNEEAKFRVIDFDRVEQKNVLSQFHGKASVGKNKAQSMQQTMKFLYGLKLEGLPRKIQANNVDVLLKGSDLVIDCLDNLEARQLIQDYVRDNDIPCVHGALAADGAFGRVIWDEQFVIDPEAGEGGATCEDGEHLAFIGIVSTYLARSVHEFLNNERKFGYQINPTGAIRV
ncbi:MAG: thiamine biosynthesis protein ThiF [Flammeovirgaceae bacterium]|nr:thiamine biosynthesis protein ThiF [Flammeovirgaceae bacterium]|tara:strand:- start:391 stop:969 length:579 start_codon:yes stop_codon:yes gene_type:complete